MALVEAYALSLFVFTIIWVRAPLKALVGTISVAAGLELAPSISKSISNVA